MNNQVYSFPFIYWYKRHHHHNKVSQWHDFSGLIPAMFTTFFYYGVMQIAIDVLICAEIKILRRVLTS